MAMPRLFTAEQDHNIRRDYETGKTLAALVSTWGGTPATLASAIRRVGGTLRGHADHRRIFTDEEEESIREDYDAGFTSDEIAERLGQWSVTIRGIIRRRGGTIRFRRRYSLNEDAFAGELAPDAAYFVGLMLADGSICVGRGTARISLGLKTSDVSLVKEFQSFIGLSRPIFFDSRGAATAIAYSLKMADDLARHGVVPRKTWTAYVPSHLATNRDFWRGVIDGDGCLAFNSGTGDPALGICGTRDVCASFLEFCKTICSPRSQPRQGQGGNYWNAWVHSRNAVKVAAVLYANCQRSLERKHKLARRFASWGRSKDLLIIDI